MHRSWKPQDFKNLLLILLHDLGTALKEGKKVKFYYLKKLPPLKIFHRGCQMTPFQRGPVSNVTFVNLD